MYIKSMGPVSETDEVRKYFVYMYLLYFCIAFIPRHTRWIVTFAKSGWIIGSNLIDLKEVLKNSQ
jgi:hypothetical protein